MIQICNGYRIDNKKGNYIINVEVNDNSKITEEEKIRILKQNYAHSNLLSKQDILTIFTDYMDERQVKSFISKMVAKGYLQKVGTDRQTSYQKTELLDKVE